MYAEGRKMAAGTKQSLGAEQSVSYALYNQKAQKEYDGSAVTTFNK